MSLCQPTVFLMKAGLSPTLDQDGNHAQTNVIAYQHLIGKLMYLAYEIRPNIAFVIEQFSCHNSNP